MSTQGDQQMAEMIKRLHALKDMTQAALPQLRAALEDHLRSTIAAGTDAYGKPWLPTKDGSRALVNAANAMGVAFVGMTLFVRLTGVEARHHRGLVRGSSPKGGKARSIIPIREIPAAVLERFHDVLAEQFRRTVGGST